jgi:hypothetical protein
MGIRLVTIRYRMPDGILGERHLRPGARTTAR